MKIAIFGATSYIARDLIKSFSSNKSVALDLFSRFPSEIDSWLKLHSLETTYKVLNYGAFDNLTFYDAVINFVGVGNPAKAVKMGTSIFDVTCHYDNLVLGYLEHNPTTKYIFLSSGAAYGASFTEPAMSSTFASVDINTIANSEWYSKAKIYAEIGHRSRHELSIVDLRVFSYFSSTIDLTASYFISEVLRSIYNQEIFYTNHDNIYRDYLHPDDFYQLINCVLYSTQQINMPLDCYSKAPIDKITLLDVMKDKFGLRYSYMDSNKTNTSQNFKQHYYSLNQLASSIGYFPSKTSLDCLLQETDILLSQRLL